VADTPPLILFLTFKNGSWMLTNSNQDKQEYPFCVILHIAHADKGLGSEATQSRRHLEDGQLKRKWFMGTCRTQGIEMDRHGPSLCS